MKISIIGLGLIGGSIAKAIKAHHLTTTIIAYDADKTVLATAQQEKIIDQFATNLAAAAQDADLIIIATPYNAFETILKEIKDSIKSNTAITDVCSVKNEIVKIATEILGKKISQFVPAHPIAGSEKSGLTAANENLFQNKLVVLTPTEKTNSDAVKKVTEFWQKLDAKIKKLTPEQHDEFLALTSHLPQALTFAFMAQVKNHSHYPEILDYTGTGFKDFTRLAASNPELWAEIFLANRENLLTQLNKLQKQIKILQDSLTNHHK